ncbi:MAG: hypothetical protein H0T88_10605 [Lysobacter sp.]|nr:hypothetical protein [Lysobacter sp.]
MSSNYSESEREFARQMFVDFDEEVTHWRNNYADSHFYREGLDFRDFEASIKLGINAFLRSHGRTFNELRDQLTETYERTRGVTPLDWLEASIAAEAAWDRMDARLASRTNHEARRDVRPSLPQQHPPCAQREQGAPSHSATMTTHGQSPQGQPRRRAIHR